MRMIVDFPAPFSPTIAWMVPFVTLNETSLFATTSPKVFVILRNSIMLFRHCVSDSYLPVYDFLFGLFNLRDHIRRDQGLVIFIHRIRHTVLVEAKSVKTTFKLSVKHFFYNIVNSVIDAFDHRGKD